MYSCASFTEDSSMDVPKSKRGLKKHKERGRCDIISDSKFPCKLCKKNPARMRDIRAHLVKQHKVGSFFKCKVKNLSGMECDFYCHYSMACFNHHARAVHGEYFNGIHTKLEHEESFKLVFIELDQRESKHSDICLKAKSVNKTSKKAFIKKRDLFEDKVLEDLVAGTVAENVVIRRKHYNAGLVSVKNLQKEFPRRYKRKVNNTTLGKKEIFYRLDLCVKLETDLEKNKKQ